MRRRGSGRRREFGRVAHSLWPACGIAQPRRSFARPPSGAAAGRTTLCLGVFDHLHRAPKLISLHAYDADKMIMKLANQAVCNWPSRNSGDGRSAAIVLSKYEMACLNDLTVKSTQLKFAACNECAAFVDRGGNLWLSETDLERLETPHSSAARLGFYQAELGLSLFRFSASLNR